MKFLQINGVDKPRVLKLGVDFHSISSDDNGCIVNQGVIIAYFSDCYQSRPLIEIDGLCEFEIYQTSECNECEKELVTMNDFNLCSLTDFNEIGESSFTIIPDYYVRLGSIFLPENQLKYPELYQEALEVINEKS
jgi:hypothetical protein